MRAPTDKSAAQHVATGMFEGARILDASLAASLYVPGLPYQDDEDDEP